MNISYMISKYKRLLFFFLCIVNYYEELRKNLLHEIVIIAFLRVLCHYVGDQVNRGSLLVMHFVRANDTHFCKIITVHCSWAG